MPITLARLPRTAITRARYPAIDFHVHAPGLTTDAAYKELVALLDRAGVGAIANMDGGTGAHLDAALKAGAPYRDRVANFITFSADGINEPGWSEKFAAEMERAFKAGALGMKVWKTVGLTAKNPDGTFIQADDPRLDPIWEMAAKYDRPVMIHISDSIGRFYPISPKNERFEAGLWAKPGDTEGNYYKNGYPTYDVIEQARENMHRKHPKTRFVNAHMAMLYYDPAKVAKLLDTYPERRRRDLGDGAGSRAGAAAVARVHHQVPGPRAAGHRTAARSAASTTSGRRTGASSRPTTSTSSTRRSCGPRAARPGTAAGTSRASACPTRCCARSTTRTRCATCRR